MFLNKKIFLKNRKQLIPIQKGPEVLGSNSKKTTKNEKNIKFFMI